VEFFIGLIIGFGGGIAFKHFWLDHQPWFQNIVAAFSKKA